MTFAQAAGNGRIRRAAAWGVAALALLLPARLLAWPIESQWLAIYKGGVVLYDPIDDANGSKNVVGDATYPSAYAYFDGTYVYHRLRLDDDPTGTGGQGYLQSFGWGVEIDTNQTAADYEWLFMVDGIATEEIALRQNIIQGTLGDPSDDTELQAYSGDIATNHRVTLADSSFNDDPDYFLEWRMPQSVYEDYLGIGRYTPIRFFFGSSSSTQSLVENGADLCGASDLYSGFSDFITIGGTVPTTGSVSFVADLAGTGDVTEAGTGDTLYVRVDDADENYDNAVANTFTVVLTTPAGDSETITLTETGADTSIFTGSIVNAWSTTPDDEDGVLQVLTGETVTVTYIDGIDALLLENQPRTDTLTIAQPSVTVAKSVAPSTVVGGSTVTYTVTVSNSGRGVGVLTSLVDTLPTGFTYQAGSTSGFTSADPGISGQVLTWSGTWVVPRESGGTSGTLTLTFQATAPVYPPGTYYNNVTVSGNNFSPASTGDTAPVTLTAPSISLVKAVDPAGDQAPGATLTYSVTYRNTGNGAAHSLVVVDAVPANTDYVPGSLRMGGAGSTYATATPKTDAADGDGATYGAGSVVFTVSVVSPDDGSPGSGTDEGVVFFQATIR